MAAGPVARSRAQIPLRLCFILQQNGCSKNPKASPFRFFGTMRLTRNFKKPHSDTVEEST